VLSAGGLSGVFSLRAEAPSIGHPKKQRSPPCCSRRGQRLRWDTSRDNSSVFYQPRAARAENLPPQASSFHLPPLGSKIQFCVDHCKAWSQLWRQPQMYHVKAHELTATTRFCLPSSLIKHVSDKLAVHSSRLFFFF